MATFPGDLIPLLQEVYIQDLTVSWSGVHPRPADVYTAQEALPLLHGDFTNEQPIDIRSINFPGEILPTYFNDYYNRIYVIPDRIDFGAIIGQATQSFTVWNAYLVTRQLVNVTGLNDEDVSIITGPLPQNILPLATRSYVVEADAFGAPQVNAVFDLIFDVVTKKLPVTGQRGKTWAFPPNWASSVTMQVDYKTDILTSYNGKEQRRAIRQQPRKIMEFNSLLSFDQLRELRGDLASWQDKPWAVVDHTRFVRFAADVPDGSITADLDRAGTWVRPGTAVVIRHEDRFESRTVASIAGTTVTFTTAIGTGWPADTKMQPLLTAYLDTAISTTMPTNAVMVVPTRFNIIPGSEVPPAPSVSPAVFDGRELFLFKPNWANDVTVSFEHPTEAVDYDRGRRAVFAPIGFTSQVRQSNFLDRDQNECDETADFFDRMKGRRGEFFLPSWSSDMTARQPMNAGTFLLRVVGQDVFNFYNTDTVHRTFCVVLKDGTVVPKKIENMYLVDDILGADTILEVGDVWASTIALDDVLMISWMPLSRLASDSITIEWPTDSVARYQISTTTLEYRASEAL